MGITKRRSRGDSEVDIDPGGSGDRYEYGGKLVSEVNEEWSGWDD